MEEIDLIADALTSCFGSEPARYAIWEMPGLGKSQAALKYALALLLQIGTTYTYILVSATTVGESAKFNQASGTT